MVVCDMLADSYQIIVYITVETITLVHMVTWHTNTHNHITVHKQAVRLLPTLLFIAGLYYMTRGAGGGAGGGGIGNVFKIGKSNAKKFKKEDVSVTFKDVAGCDEAKKEVCAMLC
jgi:ATP-dependent Zn protease